MTTYFFAFSANSLKVLLKVNRGTFVAGLRVPSHPGGRRRPDLDEHLACRRIRQFGNTETTEWDHGHPMHLHLYQLQW
jgi:hypothetical protein